MDDAVYFITFRLRDSLPAHIASQLRDERRHLLHGCRTAVERARLDASFALRLDGELDASRGSCVLRSHADTVAETLIRFDRCRYELHAWCVMPNHVHVLMHMAKGDDVPGVLHSWKSYTAHAIGNGPMWQREYFDRVVRSPQEFSATQAYIRANPAKAGLRDWRWVG